MARRTSRPRVAWLPPSRNNTIGGRSGFSIFGLGVAGAVGAFTVGEVALTIDNVDVSSAATTLSDIKNSGYRLRRIVGKIWVQSNFQPGAAGLAQPSKVIVTAGLIVRRIDPSTGTSLATLDATGNSINPGDHTNWADPWVWRRSWLHSNPETELLATVDDQVTNNYGHGPAAVDGPHVDQKTARIVGSEERLFLNVSAVIVTAGGGVQDALTLTVINDLRCLASMRTTTGNRRNASR